MYITQLRFIGIEHLENTDDDDSLESILDAMRCMEEVLEGQIAAILNRAVDHKLRLIAIDINKELTTYHQLLKGDICALRNYKVVVNT